MVTLDDNIQEMSSYRPVEILLATYNGSLFLEDQLNSILSQTYTDWVITVRDDGSSDGTFEILENWTKKLGSQFRVIKDDLGNLGSTKNFCQLLKISTSPYVLLCDQDDLWFPTKIERSLNLLKQLEQQKGEDFPIMVCSDLEVIDENSNTLTHSFWKDRNDDPNILDNYLKLIAHSVVTGNTILLNRSAVAISFPINTDFFFTRSMDLNQSC